MAIQLIVAKVLRDELALRGIQSLTAEELEEIAAHIFERISDLELGLPRGISASPRAATTDQPDERVLCPFAIHCERSGIAYGGHSPLPRSFIAIVLRGRRGISPR